MPGFDDEEPDVDERSFDEQWMAVEEHAVGLCVRCGHDDHLSADCPIVTPDLLRGGHVPDDR